MDTDGMTWLEVWHVLQILLATGRTVKPDKFVDGESDSDYMGGFI